MDFQGGVTPGQTEPWELDPRTSMPKDEAKCLEILKNLQENPDWATQSNGVIFAKLLIDTKTSDSKVGKQVKKIRSALIRETPEIFDPVLVSISGLKTVVIPKVRLLALSEAFRTKSAQGMKEARENMWKLLPPEGMSEASLSQFLSYIEKGRIEITADNVGDLLELAMHFDVQALGKECTRFLRENLEYKSEPFYALLQNIANRLENHGFIADLKCYFIDFAYDHLPTEEALAPLLETFSSESRKDSEALLRLGMEGRRCECRFSLVNGRRSIFSSKRSPDKGVFDYFEKLQKLCNVTRIEAFNYTISDTELQRISHIFGESLEELSIGRNRITSPIGCWFPKLVSCDFTGSTLTNEGLRELSRIAPNLQELNIDICKNVTSFLGCSRFEHLRILQAKELQLSDKEVIHLSKLMPNLQELSLSHNRVLTDFTDCIFSNLKKLDISCTNLTNKALQTLSALYGERLEELRIKYHKDPNFFMGCFFPGLIRLDAEGSSLTNESVKRVSECCKNLEILDISGTEVTSFPFSKLKKLIASFTPLTDEGVLALSKSCGGTLEELDVRWCNQLDSFIGFFWKLRSVTVSRASLETSIKTCCSLRCEVKIVKELFYASDDE